MTALVVGGGLGGLAAALALARHGIASHVLEQAPAFGEIGAGIQLGPNVFRMFDRLGIAEAISRDAVFVDRLAMMDALTGETVTTGDLGQAFRERFGAPYAVTHRADFHRTLLEACEAAESVTLETNAEVVSVEDLGGMVHARLADGGRREGAFLVGADGLWSKVREYVVGDGPPNVSGHIAYRAVLPIEEVPEAMRWNAAALWAGPRNHLVHYPLRRSTLFNLVAVFHSDRYVEGWDSEGDRDELMERFAGVSSRPMALLEKIETWRMWVLCDREPVADWSRGRICLLGDAAHPMLQYLAQGACMAMEDAVSLADALAADNDVERAFRSYTQARYLRTARVQLTARMMGEIYHAEGVRRELRNHVLSSAELREGMAWLYGGP